ncbi:hypothetical protein OROHE_004827 [Orobanche hederae]
MTLPLDGKQQSMEEFHFDEIIKVLEFKNQVVYDKVSRVVALSEEGDYLELDVCTELYPMHPEEKFRMLISTTLNMDGSSVAAYFPEGKQRSLADKFEYVMHGLLYKMDESKETTVDGNGEVKGGIYFVWRTSVDAKGCSPEDG